MNELKFCKDCKHRIWAGGANVCNAEAMQHVSLITGGPDYRYQTPCALSRADSLACGAVGKLFEAKPVKKSLWQRFRIYCGKDGIGPVCD